MQLPLQSVPYPRGLHHKIMQRVILAQIRRRALAFSILSFSLLAITLMLTLYFASHVRYLETDVADASLPLSWYSSFLEVPGSILALEAVVLGALFVGVLIFLSTFHPLGAAFWQALKQKRM